MQIIAEIRAHPTFISAGEAMCLSSSSSSAARRGAADKAKIMLSRHRLMKCFKGVAAECRVDNPPPAELLHVATNTAYSLQPTDRHHILSHYRDDIRLSDLQLMVVCGRVSPVQRASGQWPHSSSHKTIWSHNLQIAGCWLLLPTTTPLHYTCTQASCGSCFQQQDFS